jgi:hypothetical protein
MWSLSNKSIVDLLKDLSAVVAVLYIWGYISHIGYYRVLGLEVAGQPLDYLRQGGDLCTSLFITSLQLPNLNLYKHRLGDSIVLLGLLSSLLLLAVMAILMISNRVIAKRKVRQEKKQKKTGGHKNVRWLWCIRIISSALVVLSFYSVLSLELDMAKVKDVLQPRAEEHIQQMKAQVMAARASQQKPLYSQQAMGVMVRQLYDVYAKSRPDIPGINNWKLWFYPAPDHRPNAERSASYLTLLLLNILVFAAGIILFLSLRATPRLISIKPKSEAPTNWFIIWRTGTAVLIAAGLLFQLLLLPLVYATLGRTFIYPLVSIQLKQELDDSKKDSSGVSLSTDANAASAPLAHDRGKALGPSITHCVYLLAENENDLFVYDRLNFFEIKRIPRSQVLRINQLSNVSPFESCSDGMEEFVPCEVQWMPESQIVLEF